MDFWYTAQPKTGREFAAQILRERYGVLPDFACNANGKPYLLNAPLFFNASHSGGVTAVAVSGQEIGLDLQAKDDRVRAALFRRLRPAERQEDFFRLWTAKEAYVKFRGGTLAGMLKSLVFENGTLYENGAPAQAEFRHFTVENCVVCVCTHTKEPITVTQV
jgi:phosphopantetheinyl transferase